jgi:hypothetical protein
MFLPMNCALYTMVLEIPHRTQSARPVGLPRNPISLNITNLSRFVCRSAGMATYCGSLEPLRIVSTNIDSKRQTAMFTLYKNEVLMLLMQTHAPADGDNRISAVICVGVSSVYYYLFSVAHNEYNIRSKLTLYNNQSVQLV